MDKTVTYFLRFLSRHYQCCVRDMKQDLGLCLGKQVIACGCLALRKALKAPQNKHLMSSSLATIRQLTSKKPPLKPMLIPEAE
jgi:hypothetical protein